MELKVSSPKRGLSPPDCASDPEEKEISDDDDDDRNHKHRRRETRSQSSERDALEQVLRRPYRKGNKPFENGHPYREANSQSSEMWRNSNISPLEKDLSAKFEKRRPGLAPFSRGPLDLNQRIRANQLMPGDPGPGRGRGRESGSWSQRDSRFSLVDMSSQMVQRGSVPSNLFVGRGVPNVSNAQNASWSTFGLVPGIPNGGLDAIHSLGFQGTLRPPINSSLNMGISRQRCRDFEERGFCLRGDMCPMEHGVNRIVVEDVQSLSQFNLPVTLPSSHMLGAPAGPVPLPVISAPSSTLMNGKGKPGMGDNGLSLNGAFIGSAVAGGADLYDPDQPLWTNDCSETSTAFLALNPSKVDETEFSLDANPSDDQVGLYDSSDYERTVKSNGAVGSQNTTLSVWGRIGSSKNRTETREKIDSSTRSSNYIGNETKEEQEPSNSSQGATRHGKKLNGDEIGSQAMDSSLKTPSDTLRIMRKPSQKAQRTLFVSGIPQKNNRKEVILSHFRKFGEVIDIYIPLNSERAFVQFSMREEAEAALKAPDAVMGNRFIKLWWANRDSIPADGISSGNSVSITPRGVTVDTVPSCPSVANKGNINFPSISPKGCIVHAPVVHVPASNHPKPVVINSPKAPPPLQKKVESIEFLKEELRKKQEMLDQKRNDFRRKLDKLEKQATGPRGEIASEPTAKRHKVGTVADVVASPKAATPSCTGPGAVVASQQIEAVADSSRTTEKIVPHSSKTNATVTLQEPTSLKQSIRPLAPIGAPFVVNKFKLDNRPTAFKITPPLPTGLANIAALKEHFSIYGDLATVDLEDLESQGAGDDSAASKHSARISFTKRRSAEMAFLNGKCWKGHNLQFLWVASSNSSKDIVGKENPSSSSKGSSDANAQPSGEVASTVSQKAAISGEGESENLERRDSGAEHMEQDEDFQSSSTTMSSEKQSH